MRILENIRTDGAEEMDRDLGGFHESPLLLQLFAKLELFLFRLLLLLGLGLIGFGSP